MFRPATSLFSCPATTLSFPFLFPLLFTFPLLFLSPPFFLPSNTVSFSFPGTPYVLGEFPGFAFCNDHNALDAHQFAFLSEMEISAALLGKEVRFPEGQFVNRPSTARERHAPTSSVCGITARRAAVRRSPRLLCHACPAFQLGEVHFPIGVRNPIVRNRNAMSQ